METASIFLTTHEAIQAIVADFRQYDPQIILFSNILPLMTDGRIHLKRESGRNGAWINRQGKPAMKWLNGPELVAYMCDAITQTRWHPQLLATVCARVFQTRASPETDTETENLGVCLETNMENFNCRQCGSCCRFLEYRNEVTPDDVAQWRAAGRKDILKWVDEIRLKNHTLSFRTWVNPITGEQTQGCPFLREGSQSGRWICRIHDVKPAICRQFPLSRKHAVMSGCRGFKKEA
ncbi:MAG: YkgJ family cysteine cluster protein [Deltaproteobacteria bacterium]|nr:YkgJ family cysteine cluster protein [Deltaproteobacteria bacterium]